MNLTKQEKEMKVLARRSVFVLKDIEKGQVFNYENLGIRRPGNGLNPIEIEKIIGKKATKKIQEIKVILD